MPSVYLWTDLPLVSLALIFYGTGIGLESIARGTLPLALFGAGGYARVMGWLAMPSLVAQALAPFLGALLLEDGSSNDTLVALLAVAVVNLSVVGALFLYSRKPIQKLSSSR